MIKKIVILVSLGISCLSPAHVLAQNVDCTAIGQRVAKEQAGQLTKATGSVKNGHNICVVVVIVPGKEGEKPRRVEMVVPAN